MAIKETQSIPLTYRDAGVDIDAGDTLVDAIKPAARRTNRAGANPELGGFGGLFDLKAAGYCDPILVAATDGVGTKLELAQSVSQHRGLGIDLVAMCANDILAQGALPLFFLDYFATGKLDTTTAASIIKGVADGCIEAGCALIGGETAEMPGVYPPGGYDLAGFCVGAAERGQLLSANNVKDGDLVLALPSSGIHANGFSLVRKVISSLGLNLSEAAPFASHMPLGTALLTPTRIYTDAVKAALSAGTVTSISHITGGGLIENPPRVFSNDLALHLELKARPLPPVFYWMKQAAQMENYELARTFNCGIGMLISVRPADAENIFQKILQTGEDCWVAGSIVKRQNDAVILHHVDSAWA